MMIRYAKIKKSSAVMAFFETLQKAEITGPIITYGGINKCKSLDDIPAKSWYGEEQA